MSAQTILNEKDESEDFEAAEAALLGFLKEMCAACASLTTSIDQDKRSRTMGKERFY